ncbi:MAG: hypothetical protein QOE51_3880 [Actinoplanes sp.]|nr:hypothetical protein [Actinoplanes sp.]
MILWSPDLPCGATTVAGDITAPVIADCQRPTAMQSDYLDTARAGTTCSVNGLTDPDHFLSDMPTRQRNLGHDETLAKHTPRHGPSNPRARCRSSNSKS